MAKVTGKGSVVPLEADKTRGKCRRWQLRVSCGMDPRTGRYRTRTRRFEGTYTQANKALAAFMGEINRDKVSAWRADYTLKEWCQCYIERRELNKEIAPSTAREGGHPLHEPLRLRHSPRARTPRRGTRSTPPRSGSSSANSGRATTTTARTCSPSAWD